MAGVRYRGLDPRTRPIRWTGFLLGAGAIIIVFGGIAGHAVTDWLTSEQDRQTHAKILNLLREQLAL